MKRRLMLLSGLSGLLVLTGCHHYHSPGWRPGAGGYPPRPPAGRPQYNRPPHSRPPSGHRPPHNPGGGRPPGIRPR